MTDAAHTSRTTKFAAFEGLRGVLALSVCLGHYGVNNVLNKFGVTLLKQLAVFIFFALSGFVLSRAYYFRRKPFGALVVSRIARLYPLHLATLIWCVGLALVTHMDTDSVELIMTMFLLHNLGIPGARWSINFPSWSISVEMYLSLAFYFVALRSTRALAAALAIVGTACAAGWASTDLDPFKLLHGVINVGLLCGVGGFSIGVASYIIYTDYADRLRPYQRFTNALLAATLGFMLVPLGAFNWIGALFAVATLFLLPLLALTDGANILATRPFIYLGTISYSLYLIHVPMLLTAIAVFKEGAVEGPAAKLLLLACTLGASSLSYHFLERPAQNYILRRFGRRPAPVATSA